MMSATVRLCLYFEVSLSGYTGSIFAKIAADLQGDADYRGAFLLNVIFLVVFDLIGTSYNLFSCLRARKKISANMSRAAIAPRPPPLCRAADAVAPFLLYAPALLFFEGRKTIC